MTLFKHFPGREGDIRAETCWQALLGQFAGSAAKTEPGSCQDSWTRRSWSYQDHSFQTLSFDKDETISGTDEGFYLHCATSC